MAYPLNPGDIVEITFKGELFQQIVMNVFHYRYTGTTPIANGETAIQGLLTDLDAAGELKDTFVAANGPSYTMTEQRGQVVYPTRQVYFSAPVNFPGTNPADATTANVSAVILKTPDQAGHGRTGSLHIPAPPAAAQSAGEWLPGYITTLTTLATKVAKQGYKFAAPGDAQAVIWSRVKPTTPSVIRSARVNSGVRIEHRRTVGVGI